MHRGEGSDIERFKADYDGATAHLAAGGNIASAYTSLGPEPTVEGDMVAEVADKAARLRALLAAVDTNNARIEREVSEFRNQIPDGVGEDDEEATS